jgi:hypothetical protein
LEALRGHRKPSYSCYNKALDTVLQWAYAVAESMCLQISLIKPWDDWNWNGDEIVHLPIVPASRPIPGSKNKSRYNIDIREYLTTTNNAVVGERLSSIIKKLPDDDQAKFRSHSEGSFDFRADTILESFRDLRYRPKANVTPGCPDAWLYPDETLHEKGGDCEDLAFLLAALLMAAGISGYCVRVALGSLHITLPDGKEQKHDHCWVMYQNEGAVWEILEPMTKVGGGSGKSRSTHGKQPAQKAEYIPHYVFNVDHLWQIHSRDLNKKMGFDDYCHSRQFWKKFDRSFAMGVHNSIYDLALGGKIPASAISAIKRKSLILDANILTYDPRDHFDNGYIPDSWARVNDRLAAFARNNNDWVSFGAAAHSIGDFYAHTSYCHFAVLQNAASPQGQAVVYSPDGVLVAPPQYTANPPDPSLPPFDLTSANFSVNDKLWAGTKQQAAAQWAGKLISGRYAQKYDPVATFWEGFTSLPLELTQATDYKTRGALPHHNEIAVDDQTIPSSHKLYRATANGQDDRQAFTNQFRWRKNTAVAHIQQVLAANYHP